MTDRADTNQRYDRLAERVARIERSRALSDPLRAGRGPPEPATGATYGPGGSHRRWATASRGTSRRLSGAARRARYFFPCRLTWRSDRRSASLFAAMSSALLRTPAAAFAASETSPLDSPSASRGLMHDAPHA